MADSITFGAASSPPQGGSALSAAHETIPLPLNSQRTPSNTEVSQFSKPTSSRKRRRSFEINSNPSSKLSGFANPISPKLHESPHSSLKPLTAAAAMADERRRKETTGPDDERQLSPNPQREALGALMGVQGIGMSRPQDAPGPAKVMNNAVAAMAPAISLPEKAPDETSVHTSPVSTVTFGSLESGGAATATATASTAQVSSPGPIGDGEGDGDSEEAEPLPSDDPSRRETHEGLSNKAFSYPGPLLQAQVDARRGMSLPHAGYSRDDSRSPSTNKKHKCPYCSTDFTRHHNLKSHLLTHSHEKPYMCQTCDARFRRLHDLKRHTKLHTGERPHVCPKCKRSFARGDALARHNKGQGGCAGRRSSVGSYTGEGGYDDRPQGSQGGDSSMDGLMYTGEASQEPERMDEDAETAEDRSRSLPSIRRHDAPPDPRQPESPAETQSYQQRQPSTYPPVARQSLFPPSASHGGGSSSSTSPGPQPSPLGQFPPAFQGSGPPVFAQGGMTESPKPLSPGGGSHPDANIHRNRSPSLTQQFQQQHFGRRSTNHGPTATVGLPPPMTGSNPHPTAPQLPSLPGLTPPEPRYTLPSQVTHGPPPLVGQGIHPGGPTATSPSFPPPLSHQQTGLSSTSNSLSSHGTPHNNNSGDGANLPLGQATDRVWAYIRGLEAKVDRLQDEVADLRRHSTSSGGQAPAPSQIR
ncbi:hypothetical protein MMC09_005788 [Bachmanniomyces sp. S44760]|nr:hypothetical protein [Bachmanniomyces sp. S44760]